MNRLFAACIAALALSGCGGGSVCGNGVVEPGEDCDKGAQNGQPGVSCSAQCKSISVSIASLAISWSVDLVGGGDPVPGYTSPGCGNFGATLAHVTVEGPSPFDRVLDCTRYGYMYAGVCPAGADGGTGSCTPIQPGAYRVTVQLLRDDMTAVTVSSSTKQLQVSQGTPVSFPVVFGMADFLKQDYTGTLDFHANWGGKGVACKDAMPSVTAESVLLVKEGQSKAVMAMTKGGTRTDGTPGACFTSDGLANTYESIDGLPWGRYRLAIYSQMGPYCASVPVFVNPGTTNTTFEVVVPLSAPMGDGGASDGGASDGGATSCP